MSQWVRARSPRLCGYCRGSIHIGDPMLILLRVHRRELVRCQICETPPPELPPLIELAPLVLKPFVRLRTLVDALPFDFKRAQAGREPGEEG